MNFCLSSATHVRNFFALVILLSLSSITYGQTTYTWIGGSSSWGTTTNWSPTRTTPAVSDILVFNNTGTITVTGVVSQTVAQIQFTGNSDVTLQANAAAQILSINGPTLNNNVVVESSATLRLTSTNTFTIRPLTTVSQRWDISGKVVVGIGNTFNTSNVATNLTTVSATGSIDNNGGTFTTSAATLLFDAGSNYNHLATTISMAIPTATWDAASNVNINSITTATALTGFGSQSFGNVTYNCPAQTSASFALANTGTTTIKGDFNIVSTGTGALVVKSSTTASVLNVNGNTNISANLTLNAATAASTLNTYGDFNLMGGVFNISTAAIACAVNIYGNYNQVGGTFTQTSTTVSTVSFRGAGTSYNQSGGTVTNTYINYTLATAGASLTLNTNLTVAASRTFTASNGTLHCGNNLVNGAGSFTLSTANATLNIGNQDGITLSTATLTGNIQTTGGRSFAVASNYVYSGTNGQITGTGLPLNITGSLTLNLSDGGALILTNTGTFTIAALGVLRMVNGSLSNAASFNQTSGTLEYAGLAAQTATNFEFPATNGPARLIINNPNGVTLHAPRSIPTAGSLTLTSGILTTTATNVLNILNTAPAGIAGGSSTSYINGPITKALATSTTNTYLFPVGKSSYQPIQLTPSSAVNVSLTAEVFDADAGGTGSLGIASLNTNRYWKIAKTGAGNLTSLGTPTVTEYGLAANNHLTYSATASGTYSMIPSTFTGNDITPNSAVPIPSGVGVGEVNFVIGTGGTLSGIVPVGNSSSIQKLYQIAQLLNTSTVTGDVIFELQSDYDGTTGEVFPINFYQFNTSGGAWKATVRPAANATGLVTSGNPGTGVAFVAYNGVDNLTFDGRPGGTGNTIQWILRNTQTAAAFTPTLQLINDATYNNVQYLQLEGQSLASNGTVVIGATTGTTGNDYNSIQYCTIRDRSDIAGTPLTGIYALGTINKENDHNVIAYNNIFNQWGTAAGASIHGIYIDGYNTDFRISNNSIYNSAKAPTNALTYYGIRLGNTTTIFDCNIDSNYIGGTAPLTAGPQWVQNGTSNAVYLGIYVGVSTSTITNIRSNKISNTYWRTTSNLTATGIGLFSAIYVLNGGSNIEYNTIGGAVGNDSIVLVNNTTTTTSGPAGFGINHASSSGTLNIANNVVGAITTTGTTTSMSYGFTPIYVSQGGSGITRTIADNLIGSKTTANSIHLSNPFTATAPQAVIGINVTGTNASVITGNVVANLTNKYSGTGTSSQVAGIVLTNGSSVVQNNEVYNLVTSSASVGTGLTASLIGISYAPSTTTGNILGGNKIHSLKNISTATGAINVAGIAFSGSTTSTATTIVEKNLVHSLSLASSNGTATINGLHIVAGLGTFRNNMIRLGIDEAGNNVQPTSLIIGINKSAASINRIYYNTVYIGGSATGTASTYAFRRAAVTTIDTIKNNIFTNLRTNSGAGIQFATGFVTNATGITAANYNYNLYEVSGTGGNVGQIGAANSTTFALWKTNSSFDQNSFYGSAGFINPTGTATTVDLHINPSTPTQVEAGATPLGSISDDYDGDARVSPDLGADEGNFTPIDLTPPVITNPNFVNACSDMVYPVSVSITDLDAVSVAPGTVPRVYYKISTDVNAYNDNTSATAGWKYAVATNTTTPFTFNIDFGLLNGSVQPNQTIQYFIVAQDNSGNVGVMPSGLSGTLSSVALNAGNFPHISPSTFSLLPCSGVVTVGTGGQYGVFTTANGIFNAINQAPALNGNLLIKVVSDITTEDGFVGLNQWNETGVGGYSITIESDANVLRSISGSSASNAGLFRMSGADRVTFNGGAGSNKFLKFSNTGTLAGAATFNIINDSKYITINNCIVEGGASSSTNGVITIGTSTATGNDTIVIADCDIKSYAANLPTYGVYGVGTTGRDNSGVVISNCNIYDIYSATIAPSAVYIGAANSGWSITNNKIYQTAARSNTGSLLYTGIRINNSTGGGFVIDGNYIGGADASGSGVSSYGSGSAQYAGIHFWAASSPVSSITGNTIKNISFTSISASTAAQGVFSGIYVASASGVNILNNIVGANDVNGSISVTVNTNSGALVFGIRSESVNTGQVSGNIVGSITATGTGTNNAIGVHCINLSGGVNVVANNYIGSTTIANSVQINGTSTTNSSPFSGITVVASSSFFPSVRDNNIQNITNNNTGSAGTGIGIATSGGGVFSITGNTIANLSTRLSTNGVGASSSIVGITQTSANTTPHAISGNSIYNLSNNNTTGASTVTGIHFAGGTAFSVISKNLVYNLKSSNFATSGITGIHISTVCIVSNNMVRLGYDAAGASIDLPVINGVFKDGTVTTRNYFNSVYIGGTSTGAAYSYAFRKSTATQDSLRNNIFVNERTGGTGKNYAVTSTAATAAAINSNYNLLYTPNANGVLFGAGALGVPTADYTLASWNTATTGQDANSLVGTPNFVNPTSIIPNLHIQSPTAAEAAGIAISYISDDFDGDDRNLNTPTDIGADAGQFLPQDILPPSITYTAYTNACNDMPYAVSATITDNVAVSTAGNTAPRVYFKRTSDANTYNGNTSATQGWKYVVATNTTSPYTFNLDFNLLYGGPHANDSIQYFVIAQDASANTTVNSGTLALAAPTAGVALTAANFPTTGAPNYLVLLPCSGIVTVGTGGNYGVFTTNVGVFNAINQVPALNGNLILRVVSDITIEDGNVGLNQWNENGLGGYTVTIEPDANVLRSVSGTSGSNPGLFRINGADRVIFNGGSGTNKYLKFSNILAGASASTINLINDATGITINNCILEGGANSATHGVVTIGSSATSGTGNDNISINACDIKAYNANYPSYGVLATGTASRDNNDVTIADCNIYDNYSASIASSAILVNTGNNSFNITNNRIYQTVARTGVGAVLHTGIRINNTTAGGFNITGNQIGGVDALGNGTMAYTSATTMQYAGIHVASMASALSTVSGNSIKNVSIASTNIATGSNAFSGIYVSTPSWVNVIGNTVGSTTDTASIAVSITANGGTVNGIKTESVTATRIDGNTIAGIKAVGTSSNAINLIGVSTTAGNDTIVNNTIGSANVAHSIMVRGGAVSTASSASGITAVVAATYAPVISNNTVSNISNLNATANTANQQASGILASGNAYYNITGNTVRNITGYSASAGVGSASSVVGISLINGTFANNITGNTVYNLLNGAATGTPVVTGINYLATTGVANVSKNFVYNLQSNTVAGATITGLHLSSVCVATNNMVRLGYDASGNSIADASIVNGILKDGAYSTRIYFNSVYVGGAASSGASNTYAFRKNSTNQDTVRNNIFVNERNGGTGKHYGAMYFTNTTASIIGDYNIVYAPNANGILVGTSSPAVDYTTLNSWSSASSGQDVNSLIGAPNYVAPLAAVPNLHIQSPTIAEGNGINISYIVDDFDGDVRSTNSPTDIGADAGLFVMLDIFPPVITYTPIPAQDICNVQPASIQVTVTDIHTGISLTNNKPRMYIRKSAGSGVNAWGAYPSIEGTFVSGNSNVSTWNFVVDYALLGATIVQGDQLEYYFVAQDAAPIFNVGYSQQSNGTPLHSNVATVVAPPNFSLSAAGVLSFQDPLSGTVTVGTGGTYTTFNGPLGLFNAINTRGLIGNLTVEVISDVNENVAYQPLGVIPEYCGTGYNVLIRPSQAVVRQIAQSTGSSPMISLIGAKRVIFDGAYNGAGNYFLFRQSQSTPVFFFNGVASGATEDIAIKNSTIEGNSQATAGFGPGTVSFAGTVGTGLAIRNIVIDNNVIRNRSDLTQNATNAPSQLIYGGGATASSVPLKSNITISNNALFNFINGAVNFIQNNSGAGFGDSINIIGNSIFEPINFPSYFQYPIILQTGNGGGHSISYNKIGGNALPNPDITGTWNNNHSDGEIVAINTLNGGMSPYAGTQIIGNTISNMTLNGLIYTNFIGVRNEYGPVVISNNTIGGSTSANSIVNYGNGDATDITANSATIGIWNQAPNDEVIISNNTITNIGGVFGGYMTYHYTTGIQHGSNQYHNGVAYLNRPSGKITLTNNTVSNLFTASRLSNPGVSPDAMVGIHVYSRSNTSGNVLSGNTVNNLRATTYMLNSTGYSTRVYGLGVGVGGASSNASGTIEKNYVYDLNNNSGGSAPEVTAIVLASGSWQANNNVVSVNNSLYASRYPFIYGIQDWTVQGNNTGIYYNSIYIGGTLSSGNNSSYAYSRLPNATGLVYGATVTLRNNIFFNDRTGGSTNNIAIGNLTQGNSADAAVGWNSDYNFIVTRNANQIGRWVGTSAGDRTFANWKTTTGSDANSVTAAITNGTSNVTQVNAAELFVSTSTGNLHINTSPPNSPYPFFFVRNRGVSVPLVTIDIDGDPRDPSTPDLGCDEFTDCTTPVIALTANGVSGTTSACNGSAINLSVTATGTGSNCTGSYEYAISSGGLYWDGTGFNSPSAVYSSSYSIASFVPSSTASYVATIACNADLTCKANSNTVTVNTLNGVTSVNATIGTPANGTSHFMDVSWSSVTGATGYDVEYSNDGLNWTSIQANTTAVTYSHNIGDNPNIPTYYRVRPRGGSATCGYTQMISPVYTACDAPELPLIGNVTSSSLDLTLQVETPVANPSYTTYSIFCSTTNQYVQADGSLGSNEVFQTSAQWGTITVTGLSNNTNYCFYATAQNMDGDKRNSSNALLQVQQFNSNVITSNSVLQTQWYSPNTCTSGIPFAYVSNNGCYGGAAEYSGTATNSGSGCFLRSPSINCSGLNEVVFEGDISNSFRPSNVADDYILFNMWQGSTYLPAVNVNGIATSSLRCDSVRNCYHVKVKYDLSSLTNSQKSSLLFYVYAYHTSWNSNGYYIRVDNISINSTPTTACATTLNCTTPVIAGQPTAPVAVCSGAGVASISVAATGSGLTYQWQKNGSNISIGGVYSISSNTSGSTLTITNGISWDAGSYSVVVTNACSQAVTSNAVSFIVHETISGLAVSTNSPVCEGLDLTLAASVSSGSFVYYQWSGPNTYTANGISVIRTTVFEATDEGVYTVTASNACNTVSASSINVNIHPNLIGLVANSSKTQLCESDTLFLSASYIGAAINPGDVLWSWTGPNGFTSSLQNPFRYPISNTDAGIYDVYATNACGAQNAGSPSISIDTVVEADAGPGVVTNVCGALTVQLQAIGTGFWSEIGGSSSSFYPSNADYDATVTADSYGLKQYRWTVTNGTCISEDDARYFFNPAIAATVSVEGCNFTNGDSVLIAVSASGGSSTLSVSPPAGSELLLPNVIVGTSVYTMPMDGAPRTYTITDGICSTSSTVSPPAEHPTDIPYVNSQGFATADCYGNGYNKWLTFRDVNNDAILSVNDNGNNLGRITASLYRDATEPAIAQTPEGTCQGVAQVAMKRHFVLQSDAQQPFSTDVSLRLYFSVDELNDLVTASQANDIPGDDCSQYDNVTGLSDLYVTKYSGVNEDGDYSNNAPDGIYRVFSGANGTLQTAQNGFATLFANGLNHHYVELNVSEFSELWLHGSTTGSALPVEMMYLKADAINNEFIQLTWATALEISNNGFVVERSIDAQNWTVIGWVDGSDNSTVQQNYSFDDYEVSPGIVYYYRLKQIDNDGAYEYTGIVSEMLKANGGVLTIKDFMPNPAINSTELVVISPVVQEIGVEVFDVIGRKVVSENHQLLKGTNSIPFAVRNWAAGTYTAVVSFGNEVYSKKIVVIK